MESDLKEKKNLEAWRKTGRIERRKEYKNERVKERIQSEVKKMEN